jgi:hypothetical protein
MNITLENLSEDKLHKETWGFYFCDSFPDKAILYLDSYQELKKESTRKHNWEVIRQYQRIGRARDFNNRIEAKDVPFDESIKLAAKYKLDSLLEVKLWDRN